MIRRKTTKEILGESIHELAATKAVDKITIKEIVDNCALIAKEFPEIYESFSDEEEPDEEAKRQMSLIVNDIFLERLEKHHL